MQLQLCGSEISSQQHKFQPVRSERAGGPWAGALAMPGPEVQSRSTERRFRFQGAAAQVCYFHLPPPAPPHCQEPQDNPATGPLYLRCTAEVRSCLGFTYDLLSLRPKTEREGRPDLSTASQGFQPLPWLTLSPARDSRLFTQLSCQYACVCV